MFLTISLDITTIEKRLSDIVASVSDVTSTLEIVGDELLNFYGVVQFETEGGSGGNPWKELSPMTVMMRQKKLGHYALPNTGDSILWWTGRLKEGFFKTVSDQKLTIGNDVPYFAQHQLGNGNQPPQRKMLVINDKVTVLVLDTFKEFIHKL